MIFIVLNIITLAVIGAGVWWLTGFDKGYDGVSKQPQHFSRLLRTGLALFLVSLVLWAAESGAGMEAMPVVGLTVVILAVVLRSSVSEVFAHGFLRMIDPEFHDSGPYDPGKTKRYLDTIGHLIKTGQREQAIKLCEEFKVSGEVDRVTLETTLEYLGVKQNRSRAATPLQEARQFQAAGEFIKAVAVLKTMLEKSPRNTEAALLLMRIYAQDLHQRGLADEVLRQLEKQPHVHAGHIEFARRSLHDWSAPAPAKVAAETPAVPESIDEALAQGFVGTVIQRLEEQTLDRPYDFDLRLKLMEIQAVHCQNLQRANKLLRDLAADPHFNPQQVEIATAKVRAWHIGAIKADGVA